MDDQGRVSFYGRLRRPPLVLLRHGRGQSQEGASQSYYERALC